MLLFLSLLPLVSLFHCTLNLGNKKNSTLIIKSCAFSFVITLVLMAFCHTQNYLMFHSPAWHKVTGETCSKCCVREMSDSSEMRSEIAGKERSFKDGRSQLWQRLTVLKLGISKPFSFRSFVLELINIAIFSSSLCYSSVFLQEDWGRRKMLLRSSAGFILLLLSQCTVTLGTKETVVLANAHLLPQRDYERLGNANEKGTHEGSEWFGSVLCFTLLLCCSIFNQRIRKLALEE